MHDLKSPLRITWDVPSDPLRAADLLRIILEARPLFLEAFVSEEAVWGFWGIASELEKLRQTRVTVISEGTTLCQKAIAECGSCWLNNVSVILMPPYDESGHFICMAKHARELFWGLWSTNEDIKKYFAEALSRAMGFKRGVAVINPPAPALALDGETIRAAADEWKKAGTPGGFEARIHDLFLSEALGLNPFENYKGCAACHTLAHIDREGNLLACRTAPHLIGNLLEEQLDSPLKSLWDSSDRRGIREMLAKIPRECAECLHAESCRGGCHGLAPLCGGRDGGCAGARTLK